MIIERTDDEVIFRLPGDMDIDELQDIKDWLEYTEVTRKSKARQKDVDSLVRDVKKGRWKERETQLLK
jgi:hypothetical protein